MSPVACLTWRTPEAEERIVADIVRGRHMAEINGDFVVFLIGPASRSDTRSGRSVTLAADEAA
jgi:hypothetical protein